MKESILKILKGQGFIMGYKIIEVEGEIQKNLEIDLKYVNRKPMINELIRISKPGVRRYVSYKSIPRVKRGLGIAIVTTSRGVMTGKDARKQKIGGELICTIA